METEEMFMGRALTNDEKTQVVLGTLMECTKWADEIRQSGEAKEIDIWRVETNDL